MVIARAPRRVVVIGTTGAGKTMLSARLARLLDCPHIELDALFWQPNWQKVPDAVFRERVAAATAGDAWVADGNYTSKARDLLWSRADTLIWLDYSLPVILWRLTARTVSRVVCRELLWGTNRESLRAQLLSRESLFIWALQTYGQHRKQFPELFQRAEHSHLRVVHLRSPSAAEKWLQNLSLRVGDRSPQV